MTFEGEVVDDLLRQVYIALLAHPKNVRATRGANAEIIGAQLELGRPRARLSRTETRGKPFSSLGELLWYLSRGNHLDFISYYIPEYVKNSDDKFTVYGGYGPRMFAQRGIDQVENVLNLLRDRPTSRRAVIQIFNAEDLVGEHVEVPCTATLQFLLRDGLLHLLVSMRSNDAYLGLPHDIFCFTMLQELFARSLECELGRYIHSAGSLHLYDKHRKAAQQYLDELVQPRVEMPAMPEGDPWPAVAKLLEAERRIRRGEMVDAADYADHPYWADLVRLLQTLAATGRPADLERLKGALAFPRYGVYLDQRKGLKPWRGYNPSQFELTL